MANQRASHDFECQQNGERPLDHTASRPRPINYTPIPIVLSLFGSNNLDLGRVFKDQKYKGPSPHCDRKGRYFQN